MSEDIKFDHRKADNLAKVFNECKHEIDGVNYALVKEINDISAWWEGDVFEAYKNTFYGPASLQSALEALAVEAAELNRTITEISEAKKDFEKNKAKCFK